MASIFDVLSGLVKKGNEEAQSTRAQGLLSDVAKIAAEKKKVQSVQQAKIDANIKNAGVKPSVLSAPSSAPIDVRNTDIANKALSFPQLADLLPQKRDNVADLNSVSSIISHIYNTVKKPVVNAAVNTFTGGSSLMPNIVKSLPGVKDTITNFVQGGLKESIENPAQTLKDRIQSIYEKQAARTTVQSIGDRTNDALAGGTALAGGILSALPMSLSYNAAVGGLRGNKQTENIANASDLITQGVPSLIAQGVDKIPNISPESKDALSMLANIGLVTAGGKVGEGIQKRIGSTEYTGSFGNAFSDAIKQNKNVFTSGFTMDPIIKAVVAGEKALVKNPIVQSIDPTGITSGAAKVSDAPVMNPIDNERSKISSTIDTRIADFVRKNAGYDINKIDSLQPKKSIIGTTVDTLLSPVNKLSDIMNKGQEKLGSVLEKGLSSENKYIQSASVGLQNIFRDIAKSPTTELQTNQYRGGLNTSNQRAYDVMDNLYKSIDNNPESKSRIFDVIDPELAKDKTMTFDKLNPKEQAVYKTIREGLDLVHDMSYANGFISKETYDKHKGNYSPRSYKPFELPDEIQKAANESTKKLVDGIYKERGSVDEWKIENALRDPIYTLGKRLSQVFQNKTVKDYSDYIISNPTLVSDIERPGFSKLEGKGYGSLDGKYVQHQIAEEFKGFFYANEAMNKAYDALKAYDKMGVRQVQKKALTVYNPTTNLGNITSDIIFSFLAGADPLSLHKNVASLMKNKKQMSEYKDYLMKTGSVGSDAFRSEFNQKIGDVEGLAKKQDTKPTGILSKIKDLGSKIDSGVTSFYSGTDDVYKIAAFKTLLDYGNTPERAAKMVSDGFQNYSKVGKSYDLYAKTPLIGSAFGKFQANLMSILKSAAVNRPLNTAAFVMALKFAGDYLSKTSGESEDDRKIREGRLGSPKLDIPFLGSIPLAFNTPYGEVNVARMISPVFSNVELDKKTTTVGDYAEKFMPFGNLASGDTNQVFQDPLLGPLARLYTDKDFRGKSISDPNQSTYNPSTATPKEKILNQLRFIQRSYTPPVVNTAEDTTQNIMGKPDYYGKERNVPQALLRSLGIKVEQFGKEQVQKELDRQMTDKDFKQMDAKKKVTDIFNEFVNKKTNISEQTLRERLDAVQQEYPDFNAQTYYNEVRNKKLGAETKPVPEVVKKVKDMKAQLKANALNEAKQKQIESRLSEVKDIVKNTASIDEAKKQIKNKYKMLSDETIDKLIIYSQK